MPANDANDPGREARRWIARLASGAATADDLAQFRSWVTQDSQNDAAFRRERRTWQDLAVLKNAFGPDEGEAVPRASRPRFGKVHIAFAAAACMALMLSTPSILSWMEADYSSPGNSGMAIALVDGSRAFLDADSALAVDFDGGTRSVVLLKGRAWFKVRHGDARPFRVRAGDGVTQDVGTAFVVEKNGDDIQVGVTEGAVRVAGRTGRPITLAAGAQARYAAGGAAVPMAAAEPSMIGEWRNGELLLRSTPVRTAIAEIARYRSAPVLVWGDLSSTPAVSGSFRTDQPDDALETLIVMRSLETMRLPGGIVVIRPPSKK
jgi:transmembrane sensor